MRHARRARDDQGVTLVELLVAITFIAGVMLALTFASISGLRSVKAASAQTAANQLVDDQIEVLRATPYVNLPPPTVATPTVLPATTKNREGISYVLTGSVSWVADTCGAVTIPDAFLKLDVTASWTTGGTARTQHVVSYRAPTAAEKTSARFGTSC